MWGHPSLGGGLERTTATARATAKAKAKAKAKANTGVLRCAQDDEVWWWV
jgi:hypothetical protein